VLAIDGLLSVLALGFWIFCLLDVITAESSRIRNLPKVFWLLLVVVLFALGGLLWLVLGRPTDRAWVPGGDRLRPEGERPRRAATRPLGPEDSPEYEERMRRAQERLHRRPDDDSR
jgi:hypothetical protein